MKKIVFISFINLIPFLSCQKQDVPVVITNEIHDISSTEALSGGKVTDEGSSSIITRGVCWSTNETPTINDNKTADGKGRDIYVSRISLLSANTKYFVRAYASNKFGTGYGSALAFTTLPPKLPVISTKTPVQGADDGVWNSFITTGGDIYSDGGAAVTSRGVCWSTTNQSPSITDNIVSNGSGTGSYISKIDGLLKGTTYYIRAYATNNFGTAYGHVLIISTPCHFNLLNYYTIGLISPYNGNTSQPVNLTLNWICRGEGPMTYDVYLDKVPDPVKKIASGITSNTLALSNLDSATTYYWRVYAWNPLLSCDNYTSRVYKFTTFGNPEVKTSEITKFTFTSAIVGGDVVGEGGAVVSENGVFWSTSANPEFTGSKLPIGTGTGPFTGELTDLIPNTKYYVKAYAVNRYGRTYGTQVEFITNRNTYLPSIVTSPVIEYTASYAIVGGYVLSEGEYPVTERGVFWSTSENPESTGTRVQVGNGAGQFSYNLSGLNSATTYYLKAYAINIEGTVYGSQVTFNTGFSSTYPSVSDIDGNVYHIVKIGSQTWMAENLKTTRYPDGTPIALVNLVSVWNAFRDKDKAYCWYNDDIINKDVYGALYTWSAAMNGAASSDKNPSGVQGICPVGWHIPSLSEWEQLNTFLGAAEIAGGKMKEAGTLHWIGPNRGATNESGFSGLPGDYRPWSGVFSGKLGYDGFWWSSKESSYDKPVNKAWCIHLSTYWSQLGTSEYYKPGGISVRCLKD